MYWIGLSCHLPSCQLFAVDVTVKILGKTKVYGLIVWSMCAEHALSWFLAHKYTCFPNAVEFIFIAFQIMGYKLCIVGQGWKSILLLIGFVHLHRVICLIHVCTYNILN